MLRRGEIQQFGPGRYRVASAPRTEHTDLALAATAVRQGIICLLSALEFHGIGTQMPAEVWLAVPRAARVPRLYYPPLRIVRISEQFFDLGVEKHQIQGQTVRVYGVERTIADCFRFRNRIGLDVALEALKASWRTRRLDLNRLHQIAERLRVGRVMRPYLEATVL
jgi:predicted transcriptional regulator of viral defense system